MALARSALTSVWHGQILGDAAASVEARAGHEESFRTTAVLRYSDAKPPLAGDDALSCQKRARLGRGSGISSAISPGRRLLAASCIHTAALASERRRPAPAGRRSCLASTSPEPAVASRAGALAIVARPSGRRRPYQALEQTMAPDAASRVRSSFDLRRIRTGVRIRRRCGVRTTGPLAFPIAANRRSGAPATTSAHRRRERRRVSLRPTAERSRRARGRFADAQSRPECDRFLRATGSRLGPLVHRCARTMIAVSAAALTTSASPGEASVTRPTPARKGAPRAIAKPRRPAHGGQAAWTTSA